MAVAARAQAFDVAAFQIAVTPKELRRLRTSTPMIRPHLLLVSAFAAAATFLACAPVDDASDTSDDDTDPTESTSEDIVGAGRRVCSWNMRRLGNQFEHKPKDMVNAAKVIKENCDLVAVEEDMSTAGNTNTGYDDTLKALNPRYWGGLVTSKPAPFPATSNSEHYAFFYRKSAVSVCDGWGTEAKRFDDPEDIFLREPAWGCFKLKASPRELVIAAYHAIFGDPPQRKREVGFLDDDLDNNGTKDDFFAAMKASRPAGAGGEPDYILVGDFNLTTNEIKDVLPRYVDLTNGNGSTLNTTDGVSSNQYDHVIVMPGSKILEQTKPAEVLDVRTDHAQGQSFYSTVSDHLPIRFVLK